MVEDFKFLEDVNPLSLKFIEETTSLADKVNEGAHLNKNMLDEYETIDSFSLSYAGYTLRSENCKASFTDKSYRIFLKDTDEFLFVDILDNTAVIKINKLELYAVVVVEFSNNKINFSDVMDFILHGNKNNVAKVYRR